MANWRVTVHETLVAVCGGCDVTSTRSDSLRGFTAWARARVDRDHRDFLHLTGWRELAKCWLCQYCVGKVKS